MMTDSGKKDAPEKNEDGGDEPYPSVPAPDTRSDPAKKVRDKGEPFDGNFA